VGTFVAASASTAALNVPPQLLSSLVRWVGRATEAGLSAEQIRALLAVALDEPGAGDSGRRAAGGAA
jgi:GntR family transcriptional regulator